MSLLQYGQLIGHLKGVSILKKPINVGHALVQLNITASLSKLSENLEKKMKSVFLTVWCYLFKIEISKLFLV